MGNHHSYLKDDRNFKTLYENAVMLLGHMHEWAYLFNKLTNDMFAVHQFYGDPTSGVVGEMNDWCLIGGDSLILRTEHDNSQRLVEKVQNVHEIRLTGHYSAKILTDPWSEDAAIWSIEIDANRFESSFKINKVKDFPDYKNKPYSNDVIW